MNTTAKKFAALATGLALMSGATGALAVTSSSAFGVPAVVEYSQNSILVQLPGGINYLGTTTSPCTGIPAQTLDTIKIWTSFAQSALLAGKVVNMYYSKCTTTGTPYITIMDLNQ